MTVAKIFKILIIVVACVIIGALVLNVLLPNTTGALVDAVEDNIYKGTGMKFDLNGNANAGNNNATNDYSTGAYVNNSVDQSSNTDQADSSEVEGWQKQ